MHPSSSRTRRFRSPAPSRASSASPSPSTSTTRDPRLHMMCHLMTTLGQQKRLSLSLERSRRHWKGLTLVPLLHTRMSWRQKHRAGSRVHQLLLHTVFPQRQLFRRPTQLPYSHWIFSLRDLPRRSLNGLRGLWRNMGHLYLLSRLLDCLSTLSRARRRAAQKEARRDVDLLIGRHS